jgi:glycosyltransferase involved in cell wall biosynthesis
VAFVRSHFPDVRVEREGSVLEKNGYEVIYIGWDRGRTSRPQPSISRVHTYKRPVIPESPLVMLFLPLFWMYIVKDVRKNHYDVIHCCDFDTFLPSLLIGKLYKIPIIYDIFDFYAEMIIFPILNEPIRKILAYAERNLIRRADEIILPDACRITQIGEKYFNKDPVIITNSPQAIHTSESVNKEYSAKDEITLFIGGMISADRCVDLVCQTIKKIPGIKLVVKGHCSPSYAKMLMEIAKGCDRINLTLHWVDYNDLLMEMAMSDVVVVLYDPNLPNNRYSSPNKLFEAMLLKKPVIISKGISADEIVMTEQCGYIVDMNSPDQLSNTISRLSKERNMLSIMGINGFNAYNTKYKWSIMEKRLLELYAHYRAD